MCKREQGVRLTTSGRTAQAAAIASRSSGACSPAPASRLRTRRKAAASRPFARRSSAATQTSAFSRLGVTEAELDQARARLNKVLKMTEALQAKNVQKAKELGLATRRPQSARPRTKVAMSASLSQLPAV